MTHAPTVHFVILPIPEEAHRKSWIRIAAEHDAGFTVCLASDEGLAVCCAQLPREASAQCMGLDALLYWFQRLKDHIYLNLKCMIGDAPGNMRLVSKSFGC